MEMDYRTYSKRVDVLKKKYGSSKDELIKQVFLEGLKIGKKCGFDAGFAAGIGEIEKEEFEYDDLSEDYSFDDQMDNLSFDTFDTVDEILNL